MKIPVALGSISAQKENIKDVHSFKDYKEVLQILRVLIVDFRNNFFSHRCYDLNLNTKVKIESYIG